MKSSFIPKLACAVAFLSTLAYDVYTVATGQTDLKRWLPFLVPAVLGAFYLFIRWADKQEHLRRASSGQRPD